MPLLSATKTETRMTAMMADDQHAQQVVTNDAKQDSVGKTVHETTAYAMRHDWVVRGIGANSFDCRVDPGPKLVTEPSPLLIQVGNGVVEIVYGERVIFNLHPDSPPVRRTNLA